MKSIFSLLIFLIFSNYCHAHKPKFKVERFGSVKTFFRSGFNFGDKTIESQEMKIHIIGKLSQIISKRLNLKDTLMIEYDRSYNKNELTILENDNSNYKVLGLAEASVIKSNGKGIAVRIIAENVNITDVLKLVEYTILNRKKINKFLIPTDYNYSYTDENIITVLANSNDLIQKITKKQSNLIDEIINNEVELLNNGFSKTKILWKNGNFIFGINDIPPTKGNYLKLETEKYAIKDFKYYVENTWNDFFVIFNDSNCFTYFDGKKENISSQKLDEKISDFYPFRLNKDKIANKILLIPFNNDVFYVYTINKKLLQKIE